MSVSKASMSLISLSAVVLLAPNNTATDVAKATYASRMNDKPSCR